jgi:hypothetical protein
VVGWGAGGVPVANGLVILDEDNDRVATFCYNGLWSLKMGVLIATKGAFSGLVNQGICIDNEESKSVLQVCIRSYIELMIVPQRLCYAIV